MKSTCDVSRMKTHQKLSVFRANEHYLKLNHFKINLNCIFDNIDFDALIMSENFAKFDSMKKKTRKIDVEK